MDERLLFSGGDDTVFSGRLCFEVGDSERWRFLPISEAMFDEGILGIFSERGEEVRTRSGA
jgi:hypothetical protein